MKKRSHIKSGTIAVIFLLFSLTAFVYPQTQSQSQTMEKKTMPYRAEGTFEVKMTPQTSKDATIQRMIVDKQFIGDFEGTGKVEMLAFGTPVEGSGIYVAIEQLSGKLNGKTGTFAFHHTGIMLRGTPNLTVSVVPDSGTGELVGIAGKMNIKIEDGKHFYDFEYTLPE